MSKYVALDVRNVWGELCFQLIVIEVIVRKTGLINNRKLKDCEEI